MNKQEQEDNKIALTYVWERLFDTEDNFDECFIVSRVMINNNPDSFGINNIKNIKWYRIEEKITECLRYHQFADQVERYFDIKVKRIYS